MLTEPLPTLRSWVLYLENFDIPVQAKTIEQLLTLEPDSENLTAKTLSEIVLQDPLMTIHVLRNIQKSHNKPNKTPITTVAHAIMMQGVKHFFNDHQSLSSLEDRLLAYPEAHRMITQLINRAHISSYLTLLWGKLRHDIESDELVIAALLHDLAELLLCLVAPYLAQQIYQKLKTSPGLRSAEAQRQVLGFTLQQLQRELITAWHLPDLIKQLMNDEQDNRSSRAHLVILASRVARHIQYGWQDPALPDDYQSIAELTGQPATSIQEYLTRILTAKHLI